MSQVTASCDMRHATWDNCKADRRLAKPCHSSLVTRHSSLVTRHSSLVTFFVQRVPPQPGPLAEQLARTPDHSRQQQDADEDRYDPGQNRPAGLIGEPIDDVEGIC